MISEEKAKFEITEKCDIIIKEIKRMDATYLLDIYKKVKELYLLKKQIKESYNYAELSIELGMGPKWGSQLLILDECTRNTNLLINNGEIELRIVLKVLNYNPKKTVKAQDKIFDRIIKEKMNQMDVYHMLTSEYSNPLLEAPKSSNYALLLHRNLTKTKELLRLTNPKTIDKEQWDLIRQDILQITKIISESSFSKKEIPLKKENHKALKPSPFCPRCGSILIPKKNGKSRCDCGHMAAQCEFEPIIVKK